MLRTCLVLISTILLSSCGGNALVEKADAPLIDIVDRYSESDLDTIVTVRAEVSSSFAEEERLALIKECSLLSADRLDSVVVIQCGSKQIPCLVSSERIRRLELSPTWSPHL